MVRVQEWSFRRPIELRSRCKTAGSLGERKRVIEGSEEVWKFFAGPPDVHLAGSRPREYEMMLRDDREPFERSTILIAERRMSSDQEFETLVERHYGALYRFALSLTHQESDAADLAQQAFLVWARKGHQLRDRSKARTWLFTTLHRLFIELRRRADRFSSEPLDETRSDMPTISPERARRVDADTLLHALAGIDEVFRAPVALFYLEDYPYLEIAGILGVPLGTVKSRISRGIGQLQERLREPAGPAQANQP